MIGTPITFKCRVSGNNNQMIEKAKIIIWSAEKKRVVNNELMNIQNGTPRYTYFFPNEEWPGRWKAKCTIWIGEDRFKVTKSFTVVEADAKIAHNLMKSYKGPETCVRCHEKQALDVLDSVHMKWSGPTPELTNTEGMSLGKSNKGINTFCTYAMSSKNACFSCHVRKDGNASHEATVNDVDCLMCHSNKYQRKFVYDKDATHTVTNIYGESKTYTMMRVDDQGNYVTEPDFEKMPDGITMLEVAQKVHLPTRKTCLRCHAKAGGGDWTKRGDMGMSSRKPDYEEDIHLSKDGADFNCSVCHSDGNHKIGGRGIDLRQTEAKDPKCTNCHSKKGHGRNILNRHSTGQVSCQVCHIRRFGKGGETELSRDWYSPVWNPALCNGQGGFVGHETKQRSVTPEYRWFDGTSYVYNLGEEINPNPDGTYTMAKANGKIFDGKSKIVPIKNHWTVMPLSEDNKIIPPVIMTMFMTGDFDQAVREGMEEQGMSGSYSIVNANAEMLISHGVDPLTEALSCSDCHNGEGTSNRMLPFSELGYHQFPNSVKNCSLCHEKKSMNWKAMHNEHVRDEELNCVQCHTTEPIGFIKAKSNLCNDCHEYKEVEKSNEMHKTHIEKGYDCIQCHRF